MASGDSRDLRRLYEAASYEVDLPSGVEQFAVGSDSGRNVPPFVLITAFNPGVHRPSDAENVGANARLESRLRSAGHNFVTARGRSPDGAHVEPSFAVFDLPADDALNLAREFGQAAVFVWDGVTGSIAWTNPTR